MKAWHFVGDTLRDSSPVPEDGKRISVIPPLKPCVHGLHASKRLIDALQYAPGHMICRVECSGKIQHENDKLVAEHRTILWRVNGEDLLRCFARQCALDVIHLWDAPDVVHQYLTTGDKKIRAAARAAAWDAARAAARAAAGDAARAAAWDAARAAAWAAARAAAWAAAWDAAGAAAGAAAWDAARAAQNKRLTKMIMQAHRGAA